MLRIPYQQLIRRYGLPTLARVLGQKVVEALLSGAACWIVFACAKATQISKERLARKTFEALIFSIRETALGRGDGGFAVPSKLSGVSGFQDRLQRLRDSGKTPELELSISKGPNGKERIVCLYRGKTLGLVQDKHLDWLAPLVQKGAKARVLQVTGDLSKGHYLGCNVAFTGLRGAIQKL